MKAPSKPTQPAPAAPTVVADDTAPEKLSEYLTTSVHFERRVVRKMKAHIRENRRQYRSVSQLVNLTMAKALGLEL